MNPKKCVFSLRSWKFLGFIVSNKGIDVDPIKVKDIVDMSPPNNLKEL